MKIRFLLKNAYGHGGTARTTLTIAGALAARGHEVEVASVLRPRRTPVHPVPVGVRLRPLTSRRPRLRQVWRRPRALVRWFAQTLLSRLPSRLVPAACPQYAGFTRWTDLKLWRYLRRARDGALIGTTPGLNLAVARLARPGVLAVGTEHLHLHRHDLRLRAIFTEQYQRLHALVTLTERDARAYRTLLGPDARVLAIPNAAPDPAAFPAHRRAEPVVVAAGRLVHQKGFDLLIRAWPRVAAAHPEWTLRIYGRGVERDRLQAMIDHRGLVGRVQLMGFTDDLPGVFATAGLFVLSSRFEGFPLVLLEAMNAGLPVVAVDCPTGPSTLIQSGVNGLLVPPGSVRKLSAAINRALDHPRRCRQMGKAARVTTLAYGRDLIARQWEELLTSPPARGVAPAARPRYGPMSAPAPPTQVEGRSGRAVLAGARAAGRRARTPAPRRRTPARAPRRYSRPRTLSPG